MLASAWIQRGVGDVQKGTADERAFGIAMEGAGVNGGSAGLMLAISCGSRRCTRVFMPTMSNDEVSARDEGQLGSPFPLLAAVGFAHEEDRDRRGSMPDTGVSHACLSAAASSRLLTTAIGRTSVATPILVWPTAAGHL